MRAMAQQVLIVLLSAITIVTSESGPEIVQIRRVNDISFSAFREQFSRTSTPVVISGAMADWPAMAWTENSIRRKCGGKPLVRECDNNDNHVRTYNASLFRDAWGSMKEVNLTELRLNSLNDLLDAQQDGQPLYLHDQSIDILCPALLEELRVPRYFPVDYMTQLPPDLRQQHGCESEHGAPGHPSIFIGPAGTQSGLHTDAYASRFWMAVITGTKWFRIFQPSDAVHLYPTEDVASVKRKKGYHSYFEIDPFEPDLTKHFPAFAKAVIYEANVTAGDIIFIPEQWPHAVRNLESIIAVSYNLVDDFSFKKHEEWNHARLFNDDRGEEAHDKKLAAARTHIAHWHPAFPVTTTEQIRDTHVDETWRQFTQRNMLHLKDGYNRTAYTETQSEFVEIEEAGSAADHQALKIIFDDGDAKEAREAEEKMMRDYLDDEAAKEVQEAEEKMMRDYLDDDAAKQVREAEEKMMRDYLDDGAAKNVVGDEAEEKVSDPKLLHFVYTWLNISEKVMRSYFDDSVENEAGEEMADSELLDSVYAWLNISQSELLGMYHLEHRKGFKTSISDDL